MRPFGKDALSIAKLLEGYADGPPRMIDEEMREVFRIGALGLRCWNIVLSAKAGDRESPEASAATVAESQHVHKLSAMKAKRR
jgi:hypothetical protein